MTKLEDAKDLFLSHNWGNDCLGRDNHSRVANLNEALKKADMKTWFDEDNLEGHIGQGMTDGIDKSDYVAVFITEKYIDKVAQKYGLEDNCRQEYDYSVRRKGIKNLIPIVMEPTCKNLHNWHGSLGATLASQMYIDYTNDDKLNDVLREVLRRINLNRVHTLELENGTYKGAINEEKKAHGFGMMKYANGSCYEGPWIDGKREGAGGILKHRLGFTYEGSFKNDKKHGYGVLTMKNGDRYEGGYTADHKQGKGRIILADGLGEFEGDFRQGKMMGKGTFTYPDGTKYTGHFENQRINGYGVRNYANGSIYKGEWRDGARHGKGTMSFSEHSRYEGTWADDRMDGEGVIHFENGDMYKGCFKRNKMHGHGKYNYINGAEYEGEYSQGKKWGTGKYSFRDRKQYYYGEWENNKMHGKGVRYYKDDDVYEGMFLENMRHGWGKMEFKSANIIYHGNWRNDEMHGDGRVNVENCDSVTIKTKFREKLNPFLSRKVKDVSVTFEDGSLASSTPIKRKRSIFRSRKQLRNREDSVPFEINVGEVTSVNSGVTEKKED